MIKQMSDFRQRWQPTGIDPLVNPPINALFTNPTIPTLIASESTSSQPATELPPECTYHTSKKAKVTKKAKKHSKMSLNACRGEDGCLVKGYVNMPHSCAVLKPMTGMFWPTLHIDTFKDHTQLDVDSPPAEHPHGFLILYKGKVMSWDENLKEFIYRQDVPGVHDSL